jgi:Leucine-rich repeat (LRR) protein
MLKQHQQQLLNATILLLTLLGLPTMVSAATDCNVVTEISKVECESLLQLYHSTDGPNWGRNDGWNVTNTPCSWYRVTCEGKGVAKIDLRYNNLSGSFPNFKGLPHLQTLQLQSNQLTTVPNFSNLPNLQALDLGSNKLTTVPNFSAQPKLQTLELWNNQLTTVPNFSTLPKLQTLDLGSNKLTTVPNFSALPKLQELNLRSNQLTTVPNFSALPKLHELYLWDNQLTTVPNFSGMPNLKNLLLSENQLTTVPNFSAMPNLEYVSLYRNQLTTVPNFSAMPNLKDLSLSGNQLTTVPNFLGLPNLQVLVLHNNQLTTVPNFSAMPNLENLSLFGNQLTTVPNFSALPNLKSLSLRQNQLTTVPDFSNLPNLQELTLQKNQLTGAIPNFAHLTQLKYFDIRENSVCKDSNVDYTTWSVLRAQPRFLNKGVDTGLLWQEELAGFPDCPTSLYPIAQFTLSPNQGKAPLTVYLDASESTYPDGNLVEYQWTASDGRQVFGPNQQFTFNNPGTYSITLKVTNNHGVTDIHQQPLTVEAGEEIDDDTTFAHLEFDGLKDFYKVGETVAIELVETVHRDKYTRLDLWVAVQLPDNSLLFRTDVPLMPWSPTPQAHKTSVENTETSHHIFDFELSEGMGGDYGLYAAYVVEGENPVVENGLLWLRSNLAFRQITLANRKR